MIKDDERAELERIIAGGRFDRSFWHSRWRIAREPSMEEELRTQLRSMPTETVNDKRAARKIVSKLAKLAGKKRAFTTSGYAQEWSAEQKRLDNLEHAAIYIDRANTDFHFYA
jgi:hypothetical protein